MPNINDLYNQFKSDPLGLLRGWLGTSPQPGSLNFAGTELLSYNQKNMGDYANYLNTIQGSDAEPGQYVPGFTDYMSVYKQAAKFGSTAVPTLQAYQLMQLNDAESKHALGAGQNPLTKDNMDPYVTQSHSGFQNPLAYKYGGISGYTAIQAEVGEKLVTPDYSVMDAAAQKKHSQMGDTEKTDVLPKGTFVAPEAVKLKKSTFEGKPFDVVMSVVGELGENKKPTMPKDFKISDLFGKNKELSVAKLVGLVAKKFPVSEPFNSEVEPAKLSAITQMTNDVNRASRQAFIRPIIAATMDKNPKKFLVGEEPIQKAGVGTMIGLFGDLFGAGFQYKNNMSTINKLEEQYGIGERKQRGWIDAGTGFAAAGVLGQDRSVPDRNYRGLTLEHINRAYKRPSYADEDYRLATMDASLNQGLRGIRGLGMTNVNHQAAHMSGMVAQGMGQKSQYMLAARAQNEATERAKYQALYGEMEKRGREDHFDAQMRIANRNRGISDLAGIGTNYANQRGALDASRTMFDMGTTKARNNAKNDMIQVGRDGSRALGASIDGDINQLVSLYTGNPSMFGGAPATTPAPQASSPPILDWRYDNNANLYPRGAEITYPFSGPTSPNYDMYNIFPEGAPAPQASSPPILDWRYDNNANLYPRGAEITYPFSGPTSPNDELPDVSSPARQIQQEVEELRRGETTELSPDVEEVDYTPPKSGEVKTTETTPPGVESPPAKEALREVEDKPSDTKKVTDATVPDKLEQPSIEDDVPDQKLPGTIKSDENWDKVVKETRGLEGKGKFAESEAKLTEYIERNPDNADAYRRRGDMRGVRTDYDQAIADYDQSIKRDPDPRTYNDRANAYRRRAQDKVKAGDTNGALNDYRRVYSDLTEAEKGFGPGTTVTADKAETKRVITELENKQKETESDYIPVESVEKQGGASTDTSQSSSKEATSSATDDVLDFIPKEDYREVIKRGNPAEMKSFIDTHESGDEVDQVRRAYEQKFKELPESKSEKEEPQKGQPPKGTRQPAVGERKAAQGARMPAQGERMQAGEVDASSPSEKAAKTSVDKIIKAPSGVQYDLSTYATDPNHAKSVQSIINKIGKAESESDIDSYIKKTNANSPLTGTMIKDAADEYNIGMVELTAILQQESMLGTSNVATTNNNPGGITWNKNFPESMKGTARPAKEGGYYVKYKTIEAGIKAVAAQLARRIKK